LHARPTRQVFERAAALVSEHDPVDRELGAHVLRELGSDSFEPYPFRGKAVAILTARLENEHHPRVICAIVSALGFQHARESLDAVVRLRDHEDASVRLEVATALNGLVDAASPDSQSLTALRALADDTEAEVRYSALTTLVDDIAAPRRVVRRAARRRRRDPDQQVRRVARDYRRPRVRRRRLLIIVATGAAVVAQRRRP
jgi:HEAT repeat protein